MKKERQFRGQRTKLMRKRSNPNDTGLNHATSKGDSIQKDKIIRWLIKYLE